MIKLNLPQRILVLLIVLSGSFTSHNQCHGIRLNPNGGYDIVIGVEDSTPEPLNVNHFLDEIKYGIDSFSMELWKATNRRFFINSVDVLVPVDWWTVSDFATATWQTLLESEIRISHDVAAPNVINPNPCGVAGLHLELPDSFFKVARGGQYGPIDKALVNLWARYRFGVREEHGIPGDTRFPYFYTYPSFEPKWEATGCSNEEITGSFLTVEGDVSERCDPSSSKGPDDDCRFIPSSSNTANSSLLHFHWLDSVTQFCDNKTHNYAAPNRHNLFCGHRSVWDVIRESDDYKSTKICTESVARPKFRVMKESRSPEFYILLDRGRTITPEKVLQEVMGAMVKFVSAPSLESINIAVGTYPHANQGKNHYYVKEEVGWAPISSVIYDIQRVLDESSNPDGPVIRDAGLAIEEVVEKVKRRNHSAGTVILVIKRGASPNIFDKLTYEQEVIASVRDDSRIKVYAIETQQGVPTPYTNLQSLVEETSGQYHEINDTMNTARKLEGFLANMQEVLEQPSIMNSFVSWVTQKQYTEPDQEIEIPIYDDVTLVRVHLTTNRHILSSNIQLDQVSGEHNIVITTEKGEWNENSDPSRRQVFSYTIRSPKQGSRWVLKHGCHTEKLSECRFFLVVTAETDRPTPRQSTFNSHSISIDVSTSAQYKYLDMSHQGVRIVPFAIFAKIEMNQQRVLGLKNVTALIRLNGDHSISWTIPLHDDGHGLPDVSSYDGIYSGVFTPLQDGLYQISVTAIGLSGDGTFQDIRLVNHPGSLMPRNQINFGCKNSTKPKCLSAVPRGSFSRVQDMVGTVAVENSATFKPGKPMRILDFTVTTLPNFDIEFEFTSPRLLGSDATADEFRIYMAPHVDNFIGSTDMTKVLIIQVAEPPGTHVKISFNAARKAIPFYAVETIYGGQKSGPSNVVGVVPSETGGMPFPTTTTPQPPTTSTTTQEPTSTTEGSTTTTEYPWPSTSTTTGLPTTTDESEETEEPTTEPSFTTTILTTQDAEITGTVTSTSTTEAPSTTDASSTISTTDDGPSPSTTDAAFSSTTTTGTPSTSSTTEGDSSSTPIVSSTTESPSTSSTTEGEFSSTPIVSSTTESHSTSSTNGGEFSSTPVVSSTTESPSTSSTTEGEFSSTPVVSSTTEVPSTSSTTDGAFPSSSTEVPTTTTDATSTISTTDDINPPSTTVTPSTSTTTEEVTSSTTTEVPITSSTTEVISSSSTTEEITSTTETPSTSSTTEVISTSSTTDKVSPSSTTTESPTTSSTTEDLSTSTTTSESPITSDITDPIGSSTTSTTTETPSSTPDEDLTTLLPSSTTEPPTSSSTDPSTTELETSSTTQTPETSTSDTITSTTSEPPFITSDMTGTITTSTTPEPTESTSTTSEPPETSTSSTVTPLPTTSVGTTESPSSTLTWLPPITSSTTTEHSTTLESSEGTSTSTTAGPSTTDEGTTPEGSTSTSTTDSSSTTSSENPSTSSTSPTTSSESPSSSPSNPTSEATPEPPSSSLSTSEQVSSSNQPTPVTEPSASSSFKVASNEILLVILTFISIIYCNRIFN